MAASNTRPRAQPKASGAGQRQAYCSENCPVTWERAVDLGGWSHVPIPHTYIHTHTRTHPLASEKSSFMSSQKQSRGCPYPHTQAVQKQMGDKVLRAQ